MSDVTRYRRSAAWLVAEFVVIVLGVMTAFAADQWREARQDELAEIGYLERLRSNLEADTAVYSRAVRINEASGAVLATFLDVVDDRAPFPENHVDFVAGMNGVLVVRLDGPRQDTYDELINQGDLGRLRSSDIRNALAEYYSTRESYMAGQIEEWAADARRVEVLLIERLPAQTYRWVQGSAGSAGVARRDRVDFEPTPTQARALLTQVRGDAEIRNQLFRHQQILSRMASIHGNWIHDAAELLDALNAELARLQD